MNDFDKDICARLAHQNAALVSDIGGKLASSKLSHACIIEGGKSAERAVFARIVACMIFCKSPARPCFECHSCKSVLAGTSPDLHIYSNDGGIKVDEVRDIRADAYYVSEFEDSKVYIIEDGQKMNASAQNALLKVFEEPPENVFFIITSPSADSLLPTVSSRAVRYTLCGRSLTRESEMIEKSVHDSDEQSDILACFSAFDEIEPNEKSIEKFKYGLSLCRSFYLDKNTRVTDSFPKKKEERADAELYFNMLAVCAKDILKFKQNGSRDGAIFASGTELDRASAGFPRTAAAHYYDLFTECARKIGENGNFAAVYLLACASGKNAIRKE